MKRILILLLFVSSSGFSQNSGITYQAVVYNPNGEELPGVDNSYAPLTNRNICLQFGIVDNSGTLEYQEQVQVTTDNFGMVNLLIGTSTQTGGYSSGFNGIAWSADAKFLKVDIDIKGNCSFFEELSNQPFTYVPFAYYAINSEADNAIIVLQADVDANEIASTAADAALQSNIAAVQADVDQNESDADTAIAAVQSDVDTNETASAAAYAALQSNIAAVQADVDQNESDANTAIAAVQYDVDANETVSAAADTALQSNIAAVQYDVDANETVSDAADATLQSNIDDLQNGLLPAGSATGEIVYWDGTAWQTISPGNSGAVLQMVSGIPTWVSTPDIVTPVITVLAGTDIVEQGSAWADAGAISDGGETVSVSGTVNTNSTGTYTITYTATDAAGNTGSATRTVTVNAPNLSIGDLYQGGIIFYLDGNGGGLIASFLNQSEDAEWGCYGTVITNNSGPNGSLGFGTSTLVGTGYQNTMDIENGCTTPGTAADICANLVLNGYNDWYLPSSGEFELMVETVGPYGSSSGSAGLSNSSGAGPATYYWTSSQSTSNTSFWAYRYNMGLNNLGVNYGSKYLSAKVRAIRSF